MSTHFAHLDPALFSHPMEYDPDRWLRAEAAGDKNEIEKHLNPFGKGSRNCIGIQ